MGALAPLDSDCDSDEEGEGSEEEADPNVGESQSKEEEVKNSCEKDNEEPVIEEEIQQINTSSNNKEGVKEEEKNGGEDKPSREGEEPKSYADIAFEESYQDVSLAQQILEDFMYNENIIESEKEKRSNLCLNLLIDCYNRRAELCMQGEQLPDAASDFKKVSELCYFKLDSNERVLASAFYNIGYIQQLSNNPLEGKKYFSKALEVIKVLLVITLKTQSE